MSAPTDDEIMALVREHYVRDVHVNDECMMAFDRDAAIALCRALLATAAPALPQQPRSVCLTAPMLRAAPSFVAPDGTPEQDDDELVIEWMDDHEDGAGWCAYFADYPDEGSMRIDHPAAMECAAPAAPAVPPESEAEQFIAAAIDRAPEPLRRLGEYLSRVLDEDQWATAERMLLGGCEAAAQPAPKEQPLAGLAAEFTPGGAEHVLRTYLRLHAGKVGQHWMWAAIERVVAGDSVEATMADFGWIPARLPTDHIPDGADNS